ncbi:type VI secretion system protein ImpE [Shewanella putrefaciens]|nr:type VI secretion system protein ImpE [Shewanella putrefaciens]
MKKLNDLIKQGKLNLACEYCKEALREDPINAQLRAIYVELLCINGDLESADNQLDMIIRQHPDFLLGAVNLRQLIRADQARLDFYRGGMTANLFQESDDFFEKTIRVNLAMLENNIEAATSLVFEIENDREKVLASVNNNSIDDIRDLDDVLAGYVEIYGTDGKFYLAKFSEIEHFTVHKAESIIDSVWRRIDISIENGPSGEAFLPLTYVSSEDESSRLGKDTDWLQKGEFVATGTGLKMWLVGDEVLPITAISSFEKMASCSA